MSNLTINKMNFARKNNTVDKFIKSDNAFQHHVQCTLCLAMQDFDVELNVAREMAHDAGWRKGTDSDAVIHCCCPECVEANEVYKRDDKHYTEMNSYGE